MNPYFSTAERVELLRATAAAWKGTPYVADGASRGVGVSCAMLPYSVLVESGFELPAPPARGRTLRCELLPTMQAWLTSREGTHFLALDRNAPPLPGDVLLYDAGTGHLALCIDDHNVIHSWQGRGAHISDFRSDHTLRRLVGTWRPISNH